MIPIQTIDRRRFVFGGLAGAAAGVQGVTAALAQNLTDTRGMDPLWRDVDDALRSFFGNVEFENEGLRIDLPRHSDAGNSVPLTVTVESGMTEEDCPEVVHVLADGNPSPHVLSAWFTPTAGRAEFSTRIRLEQSQVVTVAARMRDGRHIRVDRDISVSFGACAQIGSGTTGDVFAFEPEPRISVPHRAEPGEIVPVRAAITHPMETGLRVDHTDEWVKKRIIQRFGCSMDGEEFFRVRLNPAVSSNPYFSFYVQANRSATLEFLWYDTQNITFTREARLEVTGS